MVDHLWLLQAGAPLFKLDDVVKINIVFSYAEHGVDRHVELVVIYFEDRGRTSSKLGDENKGSKSRLRCADVIPEC